MIDEAYYKEQVEKYGSEEAVIEKLPCCDYCVFEEILREDQRQVKVLKKPLPTGEHKPHRGFIEDACGKKQDEIPCPLKYCVERMSGTDDYMIAQFGAVKTFKFDIVKENPDKQYSFGEAFMEWNKKRNSVEDENGNPSSYAYRFRRIWDEAADIGGEDTLTSEGIYRIAVSKNGTFKSMLEMFNKLKEEEKLRDKEGLELLL